MAVKRRKEEVVVDASAVDIIENGGNIEQKTEEPKEGLLNEVLNNGITVDKSNIEVDEGNIPEVVEKNVKIRMRVSHRCTIAKERYDLEAGKVYTVPKNVRNILNKAGLLAPL